MNQNSVPQTCERCGTPVDNRFEFKADDGHTMQLCASCYAYVLAGIGKTDSPS